jgi:peptidylprolyl isomerase
MTPLTTHLRSAAALALLTAIAGTPASSQTSSTSSGSTAAKRPATHRTAASSTATAAHGATAAANPADNPPGVPKVEGSPKPLFVLRYVDIVTGTGEVAQPRKFFTVHYTGWLTDGTKFDSSYDHGGPYTFPYGARRVIAGWDTGFEGMHVGGKRRLYIPYALAYGELGQPPVIPPKANLIFDVELVSISDTPPPRPEMVPPPTSSTPPPSGANSGGSAQPPSDPTKPTAAPPPSGASTPSGSQPSGTNPNPGAR